MDIFFNENLYVSDKKLMQLLASSKLRSLQCLILLRLYIYGPILTTILFVNTATLQIFTCNDHFTMNRTIDHLI